MSIMKDYNVYLFDADGTLFDTAELIYRCFVYSCGKYGNREIGRDEVFGSIGLTLQDQFRRYLAPQPARVMQQIVADHMEYQLSIYRDHLKAFPGVAETLRRLRACRKKLAVVTSRKIQSLSLYLTETGMRDCFDLLITPDETCRHKPDPEPVLKAMELLGGAPGETVFIGDSVFDMECGRNAGVDTVFVTWSLTPVGELPHRPTWCIASMDELLAAPPPGPRC
jgi:pyrophosphatase PpaX